jgi:galactokinase
VSAEAQALFAEAFGDAGGVVVARAPGRVNLIGEHTDYNEGFVLPMTIGQCVSSAVRARDDRRVRLVAADFGQRLDFDLGQRPQLERYGWCRYLFGVLHELYLRGSVPSGFEMLVTGSVPKGAGLASSAALEIAVALGLQGAFEIELSEIETATLCHEIENRYAGVRCGIMDQLVSRLGRDQHALLIDCRSREYRHVPLSLDAHRVVIVDSGVRRDLADSRYNERRAECDEAATFFRSIEPSIETLRDLSRELFDAHVARVPAVIARRCRHVITENRRVLDACAHLEEGDLARFGGLMRASHESLRDDYEVSHPLLDKLVETAVETDGVLGSRLTGGGFGGCTVNLVRRDALRSFQRRIRACLESEGAAGRLLIVERMAEAVIGASGG